MQKCLQTPENSRLITSEMPVNLSSRNPNVVDHGKAWFDNQC
jgi:hypothetical protein